MYKIKFLIVILLFNSCSINKNEVNQIKQKHIIPYILPIEVILKLSVIIKNYDDDIYFVLSKEKFNNWMISINTFNDNSSEINFIKNSNRKIYINNRFFPLLMSSDFIFGSPDNGKYFFTKINSENPNFTKISIINENLYKIYFETSGKILHEGYDEFINKNTD